MCGRDWKNLVSPSGSLTLLFHSDSRSISKGFHALWMGAYRCYPTPCTLSQSPCTALTAGICLPLGLYKGTVSGFWKTTETPTHRMTQNALGLRHSQTIFRSANHKMLVPANWRPCLIPPNSPTAGSPGLCCSLPTILFPGPFAHHCMFLSLTFPCCTLPNTHISLLPFFPLMRYTHAMLSSPPISQSLSSTVPLSHRTYVFQSPYPWFSMISGVANLLEIT